MGLPEILFNLFPGMGAYSLLGRRVGMKRAEEMILSGRVYRAPELHDMGLIDVLAEDGRGEQAVYEFVRRNDKKRNGMQAVFRARQHFSPISYDELMNIAAVWVDAAMRLEDRDIRIMSRIARAHCAVSPRRRASPSFLPVRDRRLTSPACGRTGRN
jgi:DSF synthase